MPPVERIRAAAQRQQRGAVEGARFATNTHCKNKNTLQTAHQQQPRVGRQDRRQLEPRQRARRLERAADVRREAVGRQQLAKARVVALVGLFF